LTGETDRLAIGLAICSGIQTITETALALSLDDDSTEGIHPYDVVQMGIIGVIDGAFNLSPDDDRLVKGAVKDAVKTALKLQREQKAEKRQRHQHDYLVCQHIVAATSGGDQTVGFVEKHCADCNERYAVCDACAALDTEEWQAEAEHGAIMCREHFDQAKVQLTRRGAAGSA
jgi:hypothetical protein